MKNFANNTRGDNSIPQLRKSRDEINKFLSDQIREGKENFLVVEIGSSAQLDETQREYKKWKSSNKNYLTIAFSNDQFSNQYDNTYVSMDIRTSRTPFSMEVKYFKDEVQSNIDKLIEILDTLPLCETTQLESSEIPVSNQDFDNVVLGYVNSQSPSPVRFNMAKIEKLTGLKNNTENEGDLIRFLQTVDFLVDEGYLRCSSKHIRYGMNYDLILQLDQLVTITEKGKDKIKSNLTQQNIKIHDNNKKVFIVHGHDDTAKLQVAYFLKTIGLEPIILHEQPNKGRTIIEKLNDHAQEVAFAVILLTPDDIGCAKKEFDGDVQKLKPRARQNVVLELGLFIGLLGGKNVCALMKGAIEQPSDYNGVLYINMDESDGWQIRLIKELNAANLDIDHTALVTSGKN